MLGQTGQKTRLSKKEMGESLLVLLVHKTFLCVLAPKFLLPFLSSTAKGGTTIEQINWTFSDPRLVFIGGGVT